MAEAEAVVLGGLTPEERVLFGSLAHLAAMAILHSAPGTDPCVAVREVMNRDLLNVGSS